MTTRLVLLLAEDEEVIQAFLPHTSQEAFTDSIGSWGMNRRFEDLDRARFRYPSKARPELAIVITNQILRRLPIRVASRSGTRHPRIGRRSSDPDMDHPSRLQFYDEEGKERPKEQVSHRKARHRTRCSPRESAETCSTFDLVEALCELLACTSGWCACRPEGPASTILHEYAQHRRRRFSLAICLIKAMVSAATLGI